MTIQELKEAVEQGDKNLLNHLLILLNNKNSTILPIQYIDALSSKLNLSIENHEDLESIPRGNSLFGNIDDNTLHIYSCKKFSTKDQSLREATSTIIIADSIDEKTLNLFGDFVVFLPELEQWQIKDYVYSMLQGVDTKELDWLLNLYKNDLLRLYNEVKKISIFPEVQRPYIFEDCKQSGMFKDVSEYNIFNFTNALQSKDVEQLKILYPRMEESDVESLGLITILCKNFSNMIQVWLNPKPTSENTGLPSNQIYAINHIPRKYNAQQLESIYSYLLDVERKLKDGELPEEYINDYTILKILTA